MRASRVALFLACMTVIPPAHAGLLDDPEVSLVGSYLTNAFGDATEVDVQATTLRLVLGGELRLNAEVAFLRVRSADEVLGSGLGPIPVDPRRYGGGSGRSGSGPGPGGPGGAESGEASPSEPATVPREEWTGGMGDVWLGLDWTFAGGGAKEYRADIELEAKLPTADEQENLGTGELDLRLGVAAEYELWSVSLFAGAGLNRLGDPPWAELQDVLDAYAGLESRPFAERLVVFGWLQGNEAVVAGDRSRSLAGVGARGVGRLRWRVQVTTGLSGPAPDFGASFGLSFGLDRAAPARRS